LTLKPAPVPKNKTPNPASLQILGSESGSGSVPFSGSLPYFYIHSIYISYHTYRLWIRFSQKFKSESGFIFGIVPLLLLSNCQASAQWEYWIFL